MGLTLAALEVLKPYLKGRVLSLGYQDIVATAEEIARLFGVRTGKTTSHGAWHGKGFALPETRSFFSAIGCEYVCVDIAAIRGGEEIRDLNAPQLWEDQFDLVIDGGTLEHCFNVGQAFVNAASAVMSGGHIFHWNPLSMVNHGFFNFSPTLYHDFYTQNGWDVVKMFAATRDGRCQKIAPTARIKTISELSNVVLARRPHVSKSSCFVYPTQSKYLRSPALG